MNAEDQEYTLNHLPIHLIRAGEIEELRLLMRDQVFLREAFDLYGIDWLSHPEVEALTSSPA